MPFDRVKWEDSPMIIRVTQRWVNFVGENICRVTESIIHNSHYDIVISYTLLLGQNQI